MSEQTRTHLKKLQNLDTRIVDAKQAVQDFDPLFEEVEEPALILESDRDTTKSRLQEMKLEERRLELATEEKRGRITRLEERLGGVRNLREEAAVSTELDMVRRALQSDEQESMTLLDQIRKMEDRLEEVAAACEEARELVEPRRQELVEKRDVAKAQLDGLQEERTDFVGKIDAQELRLYEAIRKGGSRAAVAELTEDGACGHCFGMVPLQLQNEVRHGTSLIRCEGCGVILAAPDPNAPKEEAAPAEAPAEEAEATEADAEEAEATDAEAESDGEAADADASDDAGSDQDAEDAPVAADAGDEDDAPVAAAEDEVTEGGDVELVSARDAAAAEAGQPDDGAEEKPAEA